MGVFEIIQVAGAMLVSVLCGGGVVFGLWKWLGDLLVKRHVERVKHDLEQEADSYRTKLRKSEFLFQKEFEAASEFIGHRRRLIPKLSHSDMDWSEACEVLAGEFEKVEVEVERYLSTHGAALKEPVLEIVHSVISEAGLGKFDDPTRAATKESAERVWEALEKIETELRSAVWSQSGT